ncbi:hypothetical protein [Halorientalis sp.]|uniref:hypothetical protein n=1 Tax=Halorientalis sp. TaxID=1931229 RepID=UPI002612929F|nr:hypothetical protein [Halorientalis sp.]
MTDGAPDDSGVDHTDGAGETPADYPTLAAKFERASEVVRQVLDAYDTPAVVWTGDRDSILALSLVREAALPGPWERGRRRRPSGRRGHRPVHGAARSHLSPRVRRVLWSVR